MSDPLELALRIAIGFVVLVFSVTLHEAAHAWIARWLDGDENAVVTLDPTRRWHWISTLALPLILLFATKGMFSFGAARASRIRSGRGSLLGVLAGPAANFLAALFGAALLILLLSVHPAVPLQPVNAHLFWMWISINLILCAAHLLVPVPPLDAGRLLSRFLPPRARAIEAIEDVGLIIVGVVLFWIYRDIIVIPLMDGGRMGLEFMFGAEPAHKFFDAVK